VTVAVSVPPSTIELNLKAFEKGLEWASSSGQGLPDTAPSTRVNVNGNVDVDARR